MSSSDVKGFFRQKKKSGISKPNHSNKLSKSNNNSPSFGSDVTVRSPVIVSHDECDDEKGAVLRQFDLDSKYGPCLGMSRLARWERANALGLRPPEEVGNMLRAGKVKAECLWDGRV